MDLPKGLEEVKSLFSIINRKNFELLPQEDRDRLMALLPADSKEAAEEILDKLWDEDSSYFRGTHPISLLKSLIDSRALSEVLTTLTQHRSNTERADWKRRSTCSNCSRTSRMRGARPKSGTTSPALFRRSVSLIRTSVISRSPIRSTTRSWNRSGSGRFPAIRRASAT